MNFGIDRINFYVPNYFLDLKTLAAHRGIEVAKFYDDLGQKKMAITPPNEDVVTLAANAAWPILANEDLSKIETVIFATETGVDLSKAAATYIHRLLSLPPRCRVVELKQACYSATFGLQMGLAWLRQNIDKKVLLVAADISHYEFNSAAEPSHGGGAVAMLLSANPRVLVVESGSGFCTREVMDFWRPNYSENAFVDGRLSCEMYIKFVEETWRQYHELTQRKFSDFDRFCYHVPVPKLVKAAHKKLARGCGYGSLTCEQIDYQIGSSLVYNREIGNCYTASLYLSVVSLLENVVSDLADKLIGLYSYGSGSVGEFFAARVMPGYKNWLYGSEHLEMLRLRQELSFSEYEEWYSFKVPNDGSRLVLPKYRTGKYRLQLVEQHQRIYEMLG